MGQLPQARSDDSVAVAGDVLYVIGGYDGIHELAGVLATTDGVTFHQVGQLGETVRYGAAYASWSAVWMFGGEHLRPTDCGHSARRHQHRREHGCRQVPTPVGACGGGCRWSADVDPRGSDGHNPQDTIFAFDPATGSVSLVGSLPESVSDMATAVVGDTAYVIGGNALTAQQTIEPTTAVVAVKIAQLARRRASRALPLRCSRASSSSPTAATIA